MLSLLRSGQDSGRAEMKGKVGGGLTFESPALDPAGALRALDPNHGLSADLESALAQRPSAPKVDHQSEYDVSSFRAVEALLSQGLEVESSQGGRQRLAFAPLPFKPELQQETLFFDTPDRALHDRDAFLRGRGEVKKDGTVGPFELELKQKNGEVTRRVTGGVLPHLTELQLDQSTDDAALSSARKLVGAVPLELAAQKSTRRRLFAVFPHSKIPFVDRLRRFKPSFLIALDEEQIRTRDREVSNAKIQFQIFTKFPWTKKVTEDRIAAYEEIRKALEGELELQPSHTSSYERAVELERR